MNNYELTERILNENPRYKTILMLSDGIIGGSDLLCHIVGSANQSKETWREYTKQDYYNYVAPDCNIHNN